MRTVAVMSDRHIAVPTKDSHNGRIAQLPHLLVKRLPTCLFALEKRGAMSLAVAVYMIKREKLNAIFATAYALAAVAVKDFLLLLGTSLSPLGSALFNVHAPSSAIALSVSRPSRFRGVPSVEVIPTGIAVSKPIHRLVFQAVWANAKLLAFLAALCPRLFTVNSHVDSVAVLA